MKSWIEDDNICYEYIIRYIRDTIPKCTGQLAEMEGYAREKEVPISQPESIRMIEVLLKMMGAKRILEIGTAIGYSAIRMSRATDAEVVTVELIDKTADIAEANIKAAGLEDKITLIRGDGAEVISEMEGEGIFDAITQAAIQVASIISSTGFATTDFDQWPALSKTIIVILIFVGA